MELTGLQAEFRLVMRIDEIELPVYDPIAGGIQCRLKLLYGATCALDVHQFADGRPVFTGCGQHALIEWKRQTPPCCALFVGGRRKAFAMPERP